MKQTVSRKSHRALFSITMILLVIMLTILLLATLWNNNRHLLQVVANNTLQPYGLIVEQMDNLAIKNDGLLIEQLALAHPASGLTLKLHNVHVRIQFNAAQRLTVSVAPFDVRWSGSINDALPDANRLADQLLADDLRAAIPASRLECDSQYTCQVKVAGQGYVTVDRLRYNGAELRRLSAHWLLPVLLSYKPQDGISVEQLQTRSQFEISRFQTEFMNANLADFLFQQSVTLGGPLLEADISASINDDKILSAQITQNLQSGEGSGQFNLDALGFNSQRTLSRLLPSIAQDIEVVDGRLLADASLHWQIVDSQLTAAQGPVTLMAQSLSGYVDDAVFTRLGWHAPLSLRADGTIESRDTMSFALAELDVGVMLTDISSRARFNADSKTLELDRPSIGVFGGTVSADSLNWHPEQRSDVVLQLRNINIADILSLAAYQAVSATGILNGELPVQLTGTQAIITDGRISAAPPGGTISYRHSSQTSGNATPTSFSAPCNATTTNPWRCRLICSATAS
jgi:hypothetical protein